MQPTVQLSNKSLGTPVPFVKYSSSTFDFDGHLSRKQIKDVIDFYGVANFTVNDLENSNIGTIVKKIICDGVLMPSRSRRPLPLAMEDFADVNTKLFSLEELYEGVANAERHDFEYKMKDSGVYQVYYKTDSKVTVKMADNLAPNLYYTLDRLYSRLGWKMPNLKIVNGGVSDNHNGYRFLAKTIQVSMCEHFSTVVVPGGNFYAAGKFAYPDNYICIPDGVYSRQWYQCAARWNDRHPMVPLDSPTMMFDMYYGKRHEGDSWFFGNSFRPEVLLNYVPQTDVVLLPNAYLEKARGITNLYYNGAQIGTVELCGDKELFGVYYWIYKCCLGGNYTYYDYIPAFFLEDVKLARIIPIETQAEYPTNISLVVPKERAYRWISFSAPVIQGITDFPPDSSNFITAEKFEYIDDATGTRYMCRGPWETHCYYRAARDMIADSLGENQLPALARETCRFFRQVNANHLNNYVHFLPGNVPTEDNNPANGTILDEEDFPPSVDQITFEHYYAFLAHSFNLSVTIHLIHVNGFFNPETNKINYSSREYERYVIGTGRTSCNILLRDVNLATVNGVHQNYVAPIIPSHVYSMSEINVEAPDSDIYYIRDQELLPVMEAQEGEALRARVYDPVARRVVRLDLNAEQVQDIQNGNSRDVLPPAERVDHRLSYEYSSVVSTRRFPWKLNLEIDDVPVVKNIDQQALKVLTGQMADTNINMMPFNNLVERREYESMGVIWTLQLLLITLLPLATPFQWLVLVSGTLCALYYYYVTSRYHIVTTVLKDVEFVYKRLSDRFVRLPVDMEVVYNYQYRKLQFSALPAFYRDVVNMRNNAYSRQEAHCKYSPVVMWSTLYYIWSVEDRKAFNVKGEICGIWNKFVKPPSYRDVPAYATKFIRCIYDRFLKKNVFQVIFQYPSWLLCQKVWFYYNPSAQSTIDSAFFCRTILGRPNQVVDPDIVYEAQRLFDHDFGKYFEHAMERPFSELKKIKPRTRRYKNIRADIDTIMRPRFTGFSKPEIFGVNVNNVLRFVQEIPKLPPSRGIIANKPQDTIFGEGFTADIEEGLHKTNAFQKAKNSTKTADDLFTHWTHFDQPVCIGFDFTQFENGVSVYSLAASMALYFRYAGMPEYYIKMWFNKVVYFCNSYCVVQKGKRISGEYQTSCGNMIVVGMILHYACHICDVKTPPEWYSAGDDCLVFCEEEDVDKVKEAVLHVVERFGMLIKVEGIYREFDTIHFCQQFPVLVETAEGERKWWMINDIVRVLDKLANQNKPIERTKRACNRLACLGDYIHYMYPNVSFITKLANKLWSYSDDVHNYCKAFKTSTDWHILEVLEESGRFTKLYSIVNQQRMFQVMGLPKWLVDYYEEYFDNWELFSTTNIEPREMEVELDASGKLSLFMGDREALNIQPKLAGAIYNYDDVPQANEDESLNTISEEWFSKFLEF